MFKACLKKAHVTCLTIFPPEAAVFLLQLALKKSHEPCDAVTALYKVKAKL